MSAPSADDIRAMAQGHPGSVKAAAERGPRELPAAGEERLRTLFERPDPPLSQPGAA